MKAVGVIVDIEGTELTDGDRSLLLNPLVCGLILFSRNYESPEQLSVLTQSIHQLRADLLICVDQEGGRVQRFRDGFTRLPPMLLLESLYQRNADQALDLATGLGWLMAVELIEAGVHLSFAPVLDIERGCSQVIGDRAFAQTAEVVTELAGRFLQGLVSTGMKAVGKHFPGHGAVAADSHVSLPVDSRTREELEYDLQPFKAMHSQLSGIMPAHVRYDAVDHQNTAGFSAIWLQQILRQQIGFQGVIFSDDLSMEGAASVGGYRERTARAIEAGCNVLLACNNRQAAIDVVNCTDECVQTNELPVLNLSDWQPPVLSLSFQAIADRKQEIQQKLLLLE